jgi:putative addiction module component (TIGR02574 family)
MSTQEVTRAALALPAKSKARLAEQLLSSLEEQERADIDRAWAVEADRRLRAFRAGRMKSYPAEEVFRALENRNSRATRKRV